MTTIPLKISKIFSGSDIKFGLSLFNQNELSTIESNISEKNGSFYIKCLVREKFFIAKPEEIVRQLFLYQLIKTHNYERKRIEVEKVITFGSRESGFADIVVMDDTLNHPYIIFEVKRPSRTKGLEQLKSYCASTASPIAVWSNGNEMIRLHRDEPNIYVEIPRIPNSSETLQDILTERWTLTWLDENDELRKGKTTLKKIILDLEELVLGNSGEGGFDEIFKIIYAKLYDEWQGINDQNYKLNFFVGDRNPNKVTTELNHLFDGAKTTWSGVFEPTEKIELRPEHLKVCVSFLEKIKLFNSNLRIIDEAFEYLIPEVAKKKEGQFFTPRPVEDMVVKMLNPKANETVIDPACGSAGFLLHSVMWVAGGTLTGKELPIHARNFVQNNVYGIDFAKNAVKIAKAINLIVGDGKSHIFKDNALAPHTWTITTKSGLHDKLKRFLDDTEKENANQKNYTFMNFDILITNPPFAGTVKDKDILRLYQLAEKNGRTLDQTSRHILFINRSFQLVRSGGRLAIVIPQGILNNTNTEFIRRYVLDEARIIAVVGLHGNTFKPHTGTKTSVLFLQKYTDEEKKKLDEIRVDLEQNWSTYFEKLEEKFTTVNWDSSINADTIPQELQVFLELYFQESEELEEQEEEYEEIQNSDENNIPELIIEGKKIKEAIIEKENSLVDLSKLQIPKTKNEIKLLSKQLTKIEKTLKPKILGGQINLILHKDKIKTQFKEFWIDEKIVKKLDYKIFFGVNKKPLKDNSGDYIYKKDKNKELLLDDNGYPLFDHDLDEIADSFVTFAKNENFYFWRDNP